MAAFALLDARVEINAVVMSGFATSTTIKIEADDQETTTFGNTYRTRIAGLKNWTVDVDFNSDFAASAVDQTIWPLVGTLTTIKIRPTTGTITVTNPEYTGSVLVTEYTPLDGGVGDVANMSVSWPGSGTLTRNTT
jgi:hypothetical protein